MRRIHHIIKCDGFVAFYLCLVNALNINGTLMTTLNDLPLTSLLDRLFREAAENSPENSAFLSQFSRAELDRLLRSKTEYLDLYTLSLIHI